MNKKKYNRSIFIFRRDLRLEDNTALLAACEQSVEAIPVFCFDPRQAKDGENDYFSENAFRFMCDSLIELDEHLKKRGSRLHILEGQPEKALADLFAGHDIDALFFNKDYTPFSIQRDEAMKQICRQAGMGAHGFPDVSLTEPGEVLTNEGNPYRVFGAFERKAKNKEVPTPRRNNFDNFGRLTGDMISGIDTVTDRRPTGGADVLQQGGRKEATKTLRRIEDFKNYSQDRDIPAQSGTTRLSAHMKFGTISPREFYWTVRDEFSVSHDLISELYWRDFYLHISFHFPEVFGNNFNSDYENIPWENNEDKFACWQEGQTGFPIVDAGMRELKNTGWMHNRVRMIVASFLTKDLNIDWRWGEKHFANHLVDYDPSSNNGGWQWAASTGADAQPYFRIFNPWTQGEKHDPDAEYIKKWLPELADVTPTRIHKLGDKGVPEEVDYPEPIVDHNKMYHEAKARFKQAKK